MKDLFVELARLQTALAQATDTALTLRDAMLAASPREPALDLQLRAHLQHLATAARQIVTDLHAQQIGINFTDQELPDEKLPTSPTRSKSRSPKPTPKHPSKKAPKRHTS